MSEKLPEFIKINDDGAEITLSSKKTKISGIIVDRIKMAMPTAGTLRIAQVKYPSSNADQEAYTFSSICAVTPEELDALTVRDYSRVQLAYRFLTTELGTIEGGPEGSGDAAGEQSALPTL